MNELLKEAFEKLEPEMGISGILSELAEFTVKCGTDSVESNDEESARSYGRDANKINMLAAKIRENDR